MLDRHEVASSILADPTTAPLHFARHRSSIKNHRSSISWLIIQALFKSENKFSGIPDSFYYTCRILSFLKRAMNIADNRFPDGTESIDKHSLIRWMRLCVACILLFPVTGAGAQQTDPERLQWLADYFRDTYQADQHLINGTRYYNLYPSAPGNAFFEPDEFRTGSVIISDREYKAVLLKYDICNQRLLLRYSLNTGGSADIVLIDDPIQGFVIDGRVFRKHMIAKKGMQYCQEIGTDSLKCLYFWHKELVPLNNSLDSYNQYTNPEKNCWLSRSGKLLPFKGKKSFVGCFPMTQQHAIRKFIQENRILIRHVPDADMLRLIRFCQGLGTENAVKTSKIR
jgi:hypothetical protein